MQQKYLYLWGMHPNQIHIQYFDQLKQKELPDKIFYAYLQLQNTYCFGIKTFNCQQVFNLSLSKGLAKCQVTCQQNIECILAAKKVFISTRCSCRNVAPQKVVLTAHGATILCIRKTVYLLSTRSCARFYT